MQTLPTLLDNDIQYCRTPRCVLLGQHPATGNNTQHGVFNSTQHCWAQLCWISLASNVGSIFTSLWLCKKARINGPFSSWSATWYKKAILHRAASNALGQNKQRAYIISFFLLSYARHSVFLPRDWPDAKGPLNVFWICKWSSQL